MVKYKLATKEPITWCPGCPNFAILEAVRTALLELLQEQKIKKENIAIVTGIGCHGKIYDHLNLKAFYGLHGRVLPTAFGIKMAKPKMTVIGFGGDGGTYNEGIAHFVHNCRYNADITMLCHNNQVFSLTTGQATATTETGFVDGSTPLAVQEKPLNPLVLALEAGASFVARGYALDIPHLKELIKKAILHKGFSFIDILQPCLIYHKTIPYFQKHIYKLTEDGPLEAALKKAKEWDYCFDKEKKVAIGIFYQKPRPTFESHWPQLQKPWPQKKRKIAWTKIIKEFK